ncbi:BESS motif [Popillia japonica]|uniref:BESS motif n=1 Tax=Popillia japonica TaxID=7064 RepID=A0AAW1N1K0_POPJA
MGGMKDNKQRDSGIQPKQNIHIQGNNLHHATDKQQLGNKPHHDDDGVRAITDILRQSVELQRQEKDADGMGNKAFLESILQFLDKMSDEIVMEARMHIMQVVQAAMKKSARSDIEVQPTTPASTSAQSDISTVASIYSFYDL